MFDGAKPRDLQFSSSASAVNESETADPSASLPPDFLWNLMALTNLMRLSFRERRTRDRVQSNAAGKSGSG